VCCFFVSAAVLGLLAAYVPGQQSLGGTSSLKGPTVVASSPLAPAEIVCGGFGSTIDCVDVSPTLETFSPQLPDNSENSVFGKILSLAVSADGQRLYAGAFSGVWRSTDKGETWQQLTRPQPPLGTNDVPGALRVPNIFDLAVSPHPENGDLVLAATAGDTRVPLESKNGIYRSTDGGRSWTLVHQFRYNEQTCEADPDKKFPALPVGQIVFAPGDSNLVYAAGGCAIAVSNDGGQHWVDRPIKQGTTVGTVWHVAVAPPDENFIRRIYAAGPDQNWYSQNEGNTWFKDRSSELPTIAKRGTPGFPPGFIFPGDFGGFAQDGHDINSGHFACEGFRCSSARILAVEPGHPDHVYLAVPVAANGPSYFFASPDGSRCNVGGPRDGCGEGGLWLGDYSNFSSGQAAQWRQLPGSPNYPTSDPSGVVYVATHELPPTTNTGPYLLFFSDGSNVHVSLGRPKLSPRRLTSNSWHRLDGRDASQAKLDNEQNPTEKSYVHVDPHALVVSPDLNIRLKPAEGVPFPYDQNSVLDPDSPSTGTIWMANDGGVYRNSDFRRPSSTDAGMKWKLGDKLATLAAQFPFAGVAVLGKPGPALYFGGPDNDNFFSTDGGSHWGNPVTGCGDCGAWFADPAQPNRVLEFARGPGWFIYRNSAGEYPNAEADPKFIPTPTDLGYLPVGGYRPLVLTLKDKEAPEPDGDYILIGFNGNGQRALLRTKKLSQITDAADWRATTMDEEAKVFQQGPDFGPAMANANFVQASGGHKSPVFYVGDGAYDSDGTNLWKWRTGMSAWQQIVPSPPRTPPERSAKMARRFFVNPYDRNEIYIIDEGAIRRSVDGGSTWVDTSLDRAVTEDGRFGYGVARLTGSSNSIIDAVIKDMVFIPGEPTRFAVGNAGVFLSLDGENWERLLSTRALPGHPTAAYFDPISNPSDRMLYVALGGRGILRLGPIRTADLSITKTDSPDPVTTGQNVTYKVAVTNNGPATATSITVTDNLPTETTYVSCSSTGSGVCGGSGNNRTVTFASLASGESETITFVATVNCSVAVGTVISNSATVSSSILDPNINNNSATATTTAFNPPPTITGAAVDQPVLWPPNHKLANVTVSYEVTDNCPLPPNSCTLSVASNEPINGTGDGDTSPDWIILDAHHVQLRAERAGTGNGRIYTITITCIDSGGNSSHQSVTVSVPHDRGRR
jgi:uncharacterized repeat protein (TIGR01451 family)